jgi:hypothetical protein
MGFDIDKRKGLDRLGKQSYLAKYHNWLEQERLKDKQKHDYRSVANANQYMADGKCPYCKKKYVVTEDEGLLSRVCKKHGLLAVKKKEWRIWSLEKNLKKNVKQQGGK